MIIRILGSQAKKSLSYKLQLRDLVLRVFNYKSSVCSIAPLILLVFCQKKVAMIKAIPMPSVKVPGIYMQTPPTKKANLCGRFNRF